MLSMLIIANTYYLFLQILELQFISNDFVEITFEWHMWDNKKSGNTKEDIFITSWLKDVAYTIRTFIFKFDCKKVYISFSATYFHMLHAKSKYSWTKNKSVFD